MQLAKLLPYPSVSTIYKRQYLGVYGPLVGDWYPQDQRHSTGSQLHTHTHDVQQQQEEEETIIEKVNSTSRPLQLLSQHDPVIDNSSSDNTTTTNNSERDLRTVSILYYLVPSEWNEECGGHLTFRRGNNDDDSDNKDDDDDDDDSNVVTVYAKRNRLVLWKSQDTVYRREPFLGKNDRNNTNNVTRASTIELHLVERKQ